MPAPEGGYQLTTGTSVAAAHISGVVALMLERNPRLTPTEVRNILAATAKKLPQGRNDVGAGLVDPVQALVEGGAEVRAGALRILPKSRPVLVTCDLSGREVTHGSPARHQLR